MAHHICVLDCWLFVACVGRISVAWVAGLPGNLSDRPTDRSDMRVRLLGKLPRTSGSRPGQEKRIENYRSVCQASRPKVDQLNNFAARAVVGHCHQYQGTN
jgi:hypothetical protein